LIRRERGSIADVSHIVCNLVEGHHDETKANNMPNALDK
jgi:hypothetical protein